MVLQFKLQKHLDFDNKQTEACIGMEQQYTSDPKE